MSLSSSSGRLPRVASIITPDTSQIPSVKMSTPDSIGSCSSHENTDSLPGTPKQRVESCKVIGDNGLCSHQNELSSPSTFSISGNYMQAPTAPNINTSSDSVEYVRQAVILFEDKVQQLPEDTEFSSLPVVKKPSYLGISCSLSGYSSLTSYDSKIREGFRIRDRSPAPPHQKLVYNMPNTDDHNGIESTFQVNCETPPLERQKDSLPAGTGISSKKHKFLALECKNLSLSSLPESCGTNCRENAVYYSLKPAAEQKDETDLCIMSRRCDVSSSTLSEQTNLAMMSPLSASGTSTSLSPTPGAVRVTKLLCPTKSFVHTQVSSHEETGSIEDYGVVRTSGVHNDKRNSEDSTCTIEECKTPKSFVQQRIERLYGPGALAQSFISRVRKISSSFDESPKQVCANPGIVSSNRHLPVLRHLRPEFRAQLPLTCNSSSKLQQQLHMSGQLVPNTSSPGPESSITSLADSQPAAPDVPVIKAETPLILSESSSVDSQLIPMKSRTAADTPNACSSLSANSAVESRRTLSSRIEDACASEQEMNGHHFLKVLHKEIERLSGLANKADYELYHIQCLSEDAQGKLRAASGQARLLVKQKLQQFEGLCNKNISQCPEEPFPTTAQDLEGFWDMVKLQIDHVDLLFSEIDVLRKHNWEDNTEHESNSGVINGSRHRRSMHHCTQKPATFPPAMTGTKAKRVSPTVCDKKKSDSTRSSREEQSLARKKLMEERRQALKSQQAKSEQHVEIYVASRSGK